MQRRGRRTNNAVCSCGAPAHVKVIVSMYPLGVVDRALKSSLAFGVCEDCLRARPTGATPKLRTAISAAYFQAASKIELPSVTYSTETKRLGALNL
jgi:hypothetical protein